MPERKKRILPIAKFVKESHTPKYPIKQKRSGCGCGKKRK